MLPPATIARRHLLPLLAAGLAAPGRGHGFEVRNFTLATGDPSGTYYPVGGLMAGILTSPPGGQRCRAGEVCGVPGLIVLVRSTAGSIANLEGLVEGRFDSAFCQADVAYAAWHGDGLFEAQRLAQLRALTALYPEVAQLVVRVDAPAPPQRLAVGSPRSGTRLTAPAVLPAFGIDPAAVELLSLNPSLALDAMRRGEIDGFLTVAGLPTAAVNEALGRGGTRLVPAARDAAWRMVMARPHWRLATVPAGLYGQAEATPSLAVPALWVVRADLEADLAAALLEAVWNPAARPILDGGHPAGRQMTPATAMDGLSVPLHPGAMQYYRAAGLASEPVFTP